MDKNLLISKLNEAWSGVVLESGAFGRTSVLSLWLDAKALPTVGVLLKAAPFHLDWLENLSIVELEEVIVVSYFLRSTTHDSQLVIRVSAVPESKDAWVSIPSVKSLWSMALPLEDEYRELFGIQFSPEETLTPFETVQFLHEPGGFPLRKSYSFPERTPLRSPVRSPRSSDEN